MSVDRLWVRRNVDMDRMEGPALIDPADIRPGDVFTLTYEATCERVDRHGIIIATNGYSFNRQDAATWHLVHRPDPDAEAVQAIRSASYNIHHAGERMDPLPGLPEATDLLEKLREQGWDVTRRQS